MKIKIRFGLLVLIGVLLAGAAARAETSKELIAVLQSDAGLYEKGLACRKLAACGDKESIPVLAKLLADEKLSHLARFGLEPMPDPAAGAALREALGTLKGNLLVGVINSVGNRRDAEATQTLLTLTKDSDGAVAAAAAAALSRIANPQAIDALKQGLTGASGPLKSAVGDAGLACAEQLLKDGKREDAVAMYDAVRKAELPVYLRQAGLQGAILARQDAGAELLLEQLKGQDYPMTVIALRAARLLPGPAVTKALAGALEQLPAERQRLVIQALGDRKDPAALPPVLAAAAKGDAAVRLAAVRVLGRIGDASAVPVLFDAAVAPEAELAAAALDGLVGLAGKDVNSVMVATLSNSDVRKRRVAIDVAGQRAIAEAAPGLLTLARDPDAPTRLAAIGALRNTVGAPDFGALVELLVKAPGAPEMTATQMALATACTRIAQKDACAEKLLAAFGQADAPSKRALLQLLAQVGGEKALAAVRTAADDPNTEIRETALRALCERSNPDVLPDLARIAKNAADPRFKILALRGQLALIPKQQLGDAEKLAALKEVMAQIERKEEKQQALASLAQIPTLESLEMVETYLADPALQDEAGLAAVAIGEKLVASNPAQVKAVMQKIKSTNPQVRRGVRALMTKLGGGDPAAGQKGKGAGKNAGKRQGKNGGKKKA